MLALSSQNTIRYSAFLSSSYLSFLLVLDGRTVVSLGVRTVFLSSSSGHAIPEAILRYPPKSSPQPVKGIFALDTP